MLPHCSCSITAHAPSLPMLYKPRYHLFLADRVLNGAMPNSAALKVTYEARLAAHRQHQQQQTRAKSKLGPQRSNSVGAAATMALGPDTSCGRGFVVNRRQGPLSANSSADAASEVAAGMCTGPVAVADASLKSSVL